MFIARCVFYFVLVNLTALTSARSEEQPPARLTAQAKVEAMLRVEARKLIQSAVDKKQLRADASAHGLTVDALIELTAMQLRADFESAFVVDEKQAAALLARGPIDAENARLAKVATKSLADLEAMPRTLVSEASKRYSGATGWQLEFNRRLKEAAVIRSKKAAKQ